MADKNIIVEKSYNFAVRCVKLNRYLQQNKKEYGISNQLFRSGTSIGANIKEAIRGQSRSDFRAIIKGSQRIGILDRITTRYWIYI